MPSARVALLVATACLLAGCSSGDGGSPDDAPLQNGQPGMVTMAHHNITTPHGGGSAYTRDYAGVAREDPAQPQTLPTAPVAGPVQTCCSFAWVQAPDLFEAEQLAALRVTLEWTNTQQDQANLDVAVCIPWYCGFPDQPDQTNQPGAHSETFDIVSGGHRQFLDQGQTFLVGARFSNLVAATGVPFAVRVEAVPVGNALAFLDPYEVVVPPGGNLTATLHVPLRDAGSAGLMVYDEDDRPLAYHSITGANGSRHPLGHGAGSYVVVPFEYDGALASLAADNATAHPRAARRLTETFGITEVATLADPSPQEGTFRFNAPPGSLDTFPFFLLDSASAQVPGVSAGSSITLSSSSGVIATVDQASLGAVTPIGQTCLTCSTTTGWTPENYLDDDGSYDVAWSNTYATGRFVLFTATYSR